MQQPNKHHFLPVFYLKNWARTSDGKVVEYSKPYKNKVAPPRFVHPTATGYFSRLYEMSNVLPAKKHAMEVLLFSPIDSHAAIVLENFQNFELSRTLETKWRESWAKFVATLLTRMPHDVQVFKKLSERMINMSSEKMIAAYEKNRSESDPPTIQAYLEKEGDPLLQDSAMIVISRMAQNQQLIRRILQMEWSLLDVGMAKNELLTSDRPILMTSKLDTYDSSIILPISPTRLFIAVNERVGLENIRGRGKTPLVRQVNLACVSRARTLVIARTESQKFFIEKHMGTRHEPSQAEMLYDLQVARIASVESIA
jgi:hypothetical protein